MYQEYTAAIKNNPDLLDWFSLLNKSSVVKQTESPSPTILDPMFQRSDLSDYEYDQRGMAPHGLLQIDKEKVQKILKMKS